MKSYAILFLLSFFVFASSFQIHSQGFVSRVAVMNGMHDNNCNDKSGAFCDLLFADLLKNKNIELVEREAIDKVLAEQDIGGAGSSGSFLKAGKVLRADLLIVLLDEGGKSKLYFFDVNHGLRVEICPVDINGHKKSFRDVKVSLKKALSFINGKDKAIYSVPPFANNDILYQNDKYQGLLAENLRDELFAKGALLIEFDEALRIAGELSISDGDGEIKPLPLMLISGEFTQSQKNKSCLELKLSKMQLNDKTAELFSGKINVKSQGELKSTIAKIASLLLKNNKGPVALDMKEQLSVILKKARDHMSAEAFEQARIEAGTAIMMDTSNVDARMIFCTSITENLKTNKYRQDDPKYFQKLCQQFLGQFEWLAMNGKAGYRISYYYIIKAAKERLDEDSFLDFMVALQNIAARGMKHDYFLCRLYAQALKAQWVEANTHCIIYDRDKVERLAAVIIANKVYTQARVMISDCIGNCFVEDEPVYAKFYYILLQQKDLPYSQRKWIAAALEKLNESKKKRDGGIFYQVPQIDSPVDNLDNYFQEAGAVSETELAGIAEAVETLKGFEDYNGIRLLIESMKKSGKELSWEQNKSLGEAYSKILYEVCRSNADLQIKRKLYRIYSEKCISLVGETYKKRQMEPDIATLNDKCFQELVFSEPRDEELIALYGKTIDSAMRIVEDWLKLMAQIRVEKRTLTNDEKNLLAYERIWAIYFNFFAEKPIGELVDTLNRIDSPGTPLWTASANIVISYMWGQQRDKFARNFVEFLVGSDKYKEASSAFLISLSKDFKGCDPSLLNKDLKAIVALLPPPPVEEEKKIDVKELSLSFPKDCESLKKARLRDIIVCGKSGDAMLYDRQILFSKEPGKFEKVIKDNDNVECVSDAAWDGKYLWYAVINKNDSERKGCSRGEIICWDPARDKRKRWDSKKGIALEFLKESDKWKAERKKDLQSRYLVTRASYSVIQLFPCEGKVFVFATFYDPVDFGSGHIGRRVWIGVIEDMNPLKIFYRQKVGDGSPFYSNIKFTGKPVSCRDKILRYYGNRVTMSIDTVSLKVSFKEYRTIGWILSDSERCRAIDEYVFFENDKLWATVPSADELALKSRTGGSDYSSRPSRSNFFKYRDKLYLQIAGEVLYNIKSPCEKSDTVIDYKTFTPAFDDLLVSAHYGLLGIKDGKFYSVALP